MPDAPPLTVGKIALGVALGLTLFAAGAWAISSGSEAYAERKEEREFRERMERRAAEHAVLTSVSDSIRVTRVEPVKREYGRCRLRALAVNQSQRYVTEVVARVEVSGGGETKSVRMTPSSYTDEGFAQLMPGDSTLLFSQEYYPVPTTVESFRVTEMSAKASPLNPDEVTWADSDVLAEESRVFSYEVGC